MIFLLVSTFKKPSLRPSAARSSARAPRFDVSSTSRVSNLRPARRDHKTNDDRHGAGSWFIFMQLNTVKPSALAEATKVARLPGVEELGRGALGHRAVARPFQEVHRPVRVEARLAEAGLGLLQLPDE